MLIIIKYDNGTVVMWESVHALKTYLLFMESPKVENVHKLSFAFSEEETEGDNLKLPVRT